MRNTVAALSALLLSSGALSAEESKPSEPKPSYSLSSNAYLVTDYLFRGQTQTWGRAAIQGGFDFAHESGLYAGTWASNVSGNQFAGGSMELDLYAGYNGKVSEDIGYSAGLLYYYYPGANYNKVASCAPNCNDEKYNTLELNVGGSWAWTSAKLSYSLTDYFGLNAATAGLNGNTKGTLYLEANANYPLAEGLTLVAHLAYTRFPEKRASPINGENDPSYFDWKLGASYVIKDGWTVGAFYVDTSNGAFYRGVTSNANADTRDLNKSTFYLTLGRSF